MTGHVDEPIAIIGMSCRFPGGIDSPESLWETVREGKDAIGDFPTDRGWNLEHLLGGGEVSGAHGTTYSAGGGFLYDAAEFDAAFFNMSPREARITDPQQRIMLELAWEAIERAQIDPLCLRDSRTGVFVGEIWDEYGDRFLGDLLHTDKGFGEYEGHVSVGNSRGVLSGRISYLLGLKGPAITLDTSCSSSLVAIHLAMQSLRTGETSLALAGGVTVMSAPAFIIDFSRQRALSRDGRSKAFGSEADGMGVGEGAGLILLERLSDAKHHNHPVLAVIRGSAVNQDGTSEGQTAPNQQSQEQLIAEALANAQLQYQDIDVVEAHGTGTVLGDFIEASALLATYGRHRTPERPLRIGSFKSNVGHSQAAAGAGGVIKMVMAMRHAIMPKTLHADTLTPKVDWSSGDVHVLQEHRAWEKNHGPRRSAVSSFGISGTNAHLILEQYLDETPHPQQRRRSEQPTIPLAISAKSAESLRELAGRLRDWITDRPDSPIDDVAWSLIHTRTLHGHRAIAFGTNRDDAIANLNSVSTGHSNPNVSIARARPRKVLFAFPGQGAQWNGMGRELLDKSAAFAARMNECDEAFRPHLDWSIISAVTNEAGVDADLDQVDVVQPCLFAMMVSLDAMWRSLGVEPAGVIGHSQGEIAALCAAGGLTLDEAARVVALRSRALTAISGQGAMASILAPVDDVEAMVGHYAGAIGIAAINSARSVVVAGDAVAIQRVLATCASSDIDAQLLPVSYASHSPHVEALETSLRPGLATTRMSAAAVPFYSSLLGNTMDTTTITGDYWYQNLRGQVDFRSAVRAALADGFDTIVEVSPHPVLVPAIEQIAEEAAVDVITSGTIKRNDGSHRRFLDSAGALHAAGVPVDWKTCFAGEPTTIDLPTYPFYRKRYWVDPPRRANVTADETSLEHPILKHVTSIGLRDMHVYSGSVSQRTHTWLADHAVHGGAVFPGAAFLEIAMFVGAKEGFAAIDELTIVAPLPVSAEQTIQIQVAVQYLSGQRAEFTIHSRATGVDHEKSPWTLHANGFLTRSADSITRKQADQQHWPPYGAVQIDTDAFYEDLRNRGYSYGPTFRGAQRAWIASGRGYVEVCLPSAVTDREAPYVIHPAALDAGIQLCASGALLPVSGGFSLPFSWHEITIPDRRSDLLRVTIDTVGDREVSVLVTSDDGTVITSINSLVIRPITDHLTHDAEAPATAEPTAESIAQMEIGWEKARRGEHGGPWPVTDRWTLLGDTASLPMDTEAASWKPSIEGLVADLHEDQAAPPCLIFVTGHRHSRTAALPDTVHDAVVQALSVSQQFLSSDTLRHSCLCIVTYGAVDTGRGELIDPAAAAAWGLIRSIQREDPHRVALVDIEQGKPVDEQLRVALAVGAEQVAVRHGSAYVPRVRRATRSRIDIESSKHWQLVPSSAGVIDGIAAEPRPEPTDPGHNEVLVSVRAAGIAFRDVMIAHNIYPEPAPLGLEVAGVVAAVGDGVDDLAVGDRVFGYCYGTFADSVTVDHRHLARMPAEWGFPEAAAIPTAYLTAYHALLELAHLTPEDSILIHSAASGTGMAAVRLAQRIGADVFATASPAKHHILRDMGIPDDHIASSRNADFVGRFREVMNGQGFDVAIDSFSGALVDATLGAMAPHGRFIEIGLRDVRDADDVATEFDGVEYHAVNMTKFEPDYYRTTFAAIVELIRSEQWEKLPIRCWDIRQFHQALRVMSAGQHTGKNVMVIPRERTPLSNGTVLITGGTGMAGVHTARHLVRSMGCRNVALLSRTGGDPAVIQGLRTELSHHGAKMQVLIGDIADRASVSDLLQEIPVSQPLVGVVHAAGVLDDGLASTMDVAKIDSVFSPKVVGAWNLHDLTKDYDLSLFVLYSSIAGSLGSPGQANYAAANAYLDGLAAFRRAAGLPAVSMVWGLWNEPSKLTGSALRGCDEPMRRLGILSFDPSSALEAFDHAARSEAPSVICAKFDDRGSPAGLPSPAVPANTDTPATQPLEAPTTAVHAGGLPAALATVHREITITLGLDSAEDIEPDKAFRAMGFDSLTAVELRNRLNAVAGLRLPTTVVFDCHTPQRLAEHIADTARSQNLREGSAL